MKARGKPELKFSVVKTNQVGKRQARCLMMSESGISNASTSGRTIHWTKPPEQIYSVERNPKNPKGFVIKLLYRYKLEAHSAEDAKQIIESSKSLGLGVAGSRAELSVKDDAERQHSKMSRSPLMLIPSPSPSHPTILTPDEFQLLSLVGRGTFAKVFYSRWRRTGQVFALKVLKKRQLLHMRQIEHTITEHRILQCVRHPFITSLHFSFQTPSKLFFAMDFAGGGELFFHLRSAGRFPEQLAVFYTAEIAAAIIRLHSYDIIYRDLKPENVLLDIEGHILLADFGLSKCGITATADDTDGNTASTFCGTPEYIAPEILLGTGHGKAVDWWSVGVLFYEMLVGSPPFCGASRQELFRKVAHAPIQFPAHVSANAKDFLRKLLARKPEERLGTRGSWQVKNHPVFADIDFEMLEHRLIPPPFKPRLDAKNPVANFDPRFTSREVRPSVSNPADAMSHDEDRIFKDFDWSNAEMFPRD